MITTSMDHVVLVVFKNRGGTLLGLGIPADEQLLTYLLNHFKMAFCLLLVRNVKKRTHTAR